MNKKTGGRLGSGRAKSRGQRCFLYDPPHVSVYMFLVYPVLGFDAARRLRGGGDVISLYAVCP